MPTPRIVYYDGIRRLVGVEVLVGFQRLLSRPKSICAVEGYAEKWSGRLKINSMGCQVAEGFDEMLGSIERLINLCREDSPQGLAKPISQLREGDSQKPRPVGDEFVQLFR